MTKIINYFELLSIPEEYRIDLVLLENNYRKLQQALHPDRFPVGSSEQSLATEHSSQINTGYKTLQNNITRAKHLLEIADIKIPDNLQTTDADFLQQQFMWNMQLEEAQEQEEKVDLAKQFKQEMEQLEQQFINAYKTASLQEALAVFLKMQFVQKLIERI